jgi:beta-lactam-binding protein with PASTA domain
MRRWALVVLLATVGVFAGVGAAWAADPPDVRGLSVSEAKTRLTAWNDSVTVQLVPQSLPAGVDQSTVVVATATWLNPGAQPGVAVVRPVVRLTLGAGVPDLSGSTQAAATRVLAARGLTLRADPAQVGPEWTVTGQTLAAGTIVDFGQSVGATFAAPPSARPWTVVALIGGGALLVLALLVLLLVRVVRRRPTAPSGPSIEVRAQNGTVIGPDLDELGPSVSVRLEPRYDPGTFTLEEVPR